MSVRRLVDYPYVLVHLRCDACNRAGAYRLARLAVKYGAEVPLDDLLARLSADCPGAMIVGVIGTMGRNSPGTFHRYISGFRPVGCSEINLRVSDNIASGITYGPGG